MQWRIQRIVSVPLRGYGFEIILLEPTRKLSIIVSVPLRGYGFEILCCVCLDSLVLFPSPCGDMVLKSPVALSYAANVINGVSVPLRGYGFEILLGCRRQKRRVFVSVPLRGYGFEILAAGCLAVSGSICRFAARMRSPSLSRRHRVLKTAVYPTALSAAGISLSV